MNKKAILNRDRQRKKHVNVGYFEAFLEIRVFLGRVAGAYFAARRVLYVRTAMWTNFLRGQFLIEQILNFRTIFLFGSSKNSNTLPHDSLLSQIIAAFKKKAFLS